MKTYNIAPYFDDFSESNNYHQIMFRPGFAVQARELTQIQTILRGQIEKFGNHIFRQGSVVIPGNSYADLAVPYIKVQATYNDISILLSNFENKVIVGVTTGVKAIVKKAVAASGTDPITFYLAYLSGGSYVIGSSTANTVTFLDNEEFYLETNSTIRATTLTTGSTGVGSLAVVNSGVYYVNGTFVHVDGQIVVMGKYTTTPSCHVLLKITEELIDATTDTTLLDPAQGSYNYAAPGADRVKISLTLVTLPLGSAITEDYVELMRYQEGELLEHARNPRYSELEKSLARRTFDESGNYVVSGLTPNIREHLKDGNNNGVYVDGDASKFVVEVQPGKSYINGFEVDKIGRTLITVDKARTAAHIKDTNIVLRPEFGQYLFVSNISSRLSIRDRDIVDLYNDNDASNASATKIGTARIIGIDYLAGDVATGAIYKLWITDVTMIGSYKIEEIGGIRYNTNKYAYVLNKYNAPINSGGFTVGEVVTHSTSGRTATVKYWDVTTSTLYAYKHNHTKDVPRVGDLIVGATSATSSIISSKTVLSSIGQNVSVFQLPKSVPYSLRNSVTNSYDLQYTSQKELTIICDTLGNGSVSVGAGETIDPIEVGTFVALGPNGIIQNSYFTLNTIGNTLSFAGGGGFAGSTVKVYAAVTKSGVSPKTKTLTTTSQTFTASTSNITLDYTDIVSITSIIDDTGDITTNYSLWNGQTDFAYFRGTLTLKDNKPSPTGNVVVTYKYYAHSIAGDFFCIDSYPTGIHNTTTTYRSSSGFLFDLTSCVDFRPSVGTDGTFTGTNSRRNDLIISGVNFTSSLQFYVPRLDVLTINSAGNLNVVPGIPSESPKAAAIPNGQVPLNQIFVPAYTKLISSVKTKRYDVERFTMNDIKKISNRVDRVENFATLTASETSVTSVNVIDATTGLTKYKTGYLVENFSTPLALARTTSGDYCATFIGNSVSAGVEDLLCDVKLMQSSTGYVEKNGYLMLPYTEEVFAQQSLSSRISNLNPFIVVSWNGIVDVSPPSDQWVVMQDLPTIYEEQTEEIVVNNYIPCPPPPPPPPPTNNDHEHVDICSICPDCCAPPRPPEVTEQPKPKLPETFYGGFYGTLGRAGEEGGIAHWTNMFQQTQDYNAVAEAFNYSATFEKAVTGIDLGLAGGGAMLGGNAALTTTTTFDYSDRAGYMIVTETGVRLDGTAINNQYETKIW